MFIKISIINLKCDEWLVSHVMSRFKTHPGMATFYGVLRHVSRAGSSYASPCHSTLCPLTHSRRHREIGFDSFYRSNSSLRCRATFISSRKNTETGRCRAPTTNYFPVKRNDIFNLSRSAIVRRSKVCMMSRNEFAFHNVDFIIS